MGPQLYRCGNHYVGLGAPPGVDMLQWGRNFIVAETRPPPGPSPWGARFNGAATLSLRKLPSPHNAVQGRAASMGPQLYRCGNAGRHGRLLPGRPASMGPQLYRCGNNWKILPSACILLRFNGAATLSLRKPPGRRRAWRRPAGFNGAATLSLRKQDGETNYEAPESKLQWGRNFIVAETGRSARTGYLPAGFNGAATLSLRKPVTPPI